ncbi:ParB-like protein [Paraburkholderia bryophila]|uniref:Putative ParB-like nuclease n=1 Tax=Paraburkholderia bryophila TaxID=420952 RepID=A0A329CEV3_9BURK|nr:putative ParB-like nuclease [Paraburkholderia bryophila]
MKNIAIKELRPTQMTHGEREVAKKTDDYRKLSGHDLKMAIAEKACPHNAGTRGQALRY